MPGGDVGVAGVVFGPHIPIATVRMSDIQGLAAARRRSATGVETVVLAAVAIFEIVGPISTRFALVRSGEAYLKSPNTRPSFEA